MDRMVNWSIGGVLVHSGYPSVPFDTNHPLLINILEIIINGLTQQLWQQQRWLDRFQSFCEVP